MSSYPLSESSLHVQQPLDYQPANQGFGPETVHADHSLHGRIHGPCGRLPLQVAWVAEKEST